MALAGPTVGLGLLPQGGLPPLVPTLPKAGRVTARKVACFFIFPASFFHTPVVENAEVHLYQLWGGASRSYCSLLWLARDIGTLGHEVGIQERCTPRVLRVCCHVLSKAFFHFF